MINLFISLSFLLAIPNQALITVYRCEKDRSILFHNLQVMMMRKKRETELVFYRLANNNEKKFM